MLSTPPFQFIQRILPRHGWLCGFVLPEKKHFWAKNAKEFSEEILNLDAQGKTVYHACASYLETGSRTQKNIHSVQSLWLDVDCGADKPYTDQADGWRACSEFVDTAGLPAPLYVNSGYGLHLYWPLQEPLTLKAWLPYAQALKSLCVAHGLHADPSRTADGASLLRPVGSHNRKVEGNPVVVDWGGDIEPYTLANLSALNPYFPKVVTKALPRSKMLGDLFPEVPSKSEQIADQCAQIGNFRETLGVISEPEWKAGLGVLAFCSDGEEFAHAWSTGDSRYNPAETASKLTASKGLSGPTTCAHFQRLNAKCKGCPFLGTIASPVELGRGAPKLSAPQFAVAQEFAADPDELPAVGAFRHVAGALMFQSEAGDKPVNIRITQYPVLVESVARSELNEDSYMVQLRHKPPHEEWRTTVVSLKVLFGASGIAEIMGKGIVVHNGDLFKQYVREAMDKLNATAKAQIQYDQFGWKDEERAFLIGTRLYTADAVHDAPGGQEVRRRARGMGPQKGGSLAIWKDSVDKLFAQGFEAQGFAVLAAFSAPLMRWQAHSEGGAILSLISRKSGQGKSTALTAAASVWGRLEAMKQTNSDTKVARGIVLGVMGNLPAFRDEYTQRDPEVLREEIQIFTEGRDKQRGASDGTLINLGASWQTVMIAGSNTSLVDTLRAAKNGEAMSRRVVEFNVDIPASVAHWKGDGLKDMMDDNAGFAGDVFIRSILQPANNAYLKGLLPTVREDLIRRHALTSDQRFAARLLAGCAVAGHVALHLGLCSFSVDRMIDWARHSLFGRESGEAAPPKVPTEEPSYMLSRYLAENMAYTIVMPESFRPNIKQIPIREPRLGLRIRHDVKSNRIFLEAKSLRIWMQKEEQGWYDLMTDLTNKEMLVHPGRLITLGAGTNFATGQVPCLEIRADHPSISGALKVVSDKENAA